MSIEEPEFGFIKSSGFVLKKLSKDIRQLICKKVQFKIYQNISLATAV